MSRMALSVGARIKVAGVLSAFVGINLFLVESLQESRSSDVLHAVIRIAVVLIAGGITAWIVGALLHRRARGAEADDKEDRLAVALYTLTCMAWAGAYVYVTFVDFNHGGRPIKQSALKAGIWDSLASAGSTGDAVVNFFIYTILTIIAVALLPGMIGVLLYFIAAVLALAFAGFAIGLLIALAKISIAGALVVAVIIAVPAIWYVRTHRAAIGRAFWLVGEPVYGMFFDWWLTPILRRRKEEGIMDDVRKKRGRYDEAVSKLRSEVPEIADIPISIAPETWLANVAERFRQRQTTKTFAAQTEMLTQVKQFFGEWRAALDAEDELKRAKPTYLEKDEEADLRRMEREKRRLTLQREIGELRKEPEAPPAPKPIDRRTPEEIKVAKLQQWDKDFERDIAGCNGNTERVADITRIYEDRKIRILEEG